MNPLRKKIALKIYFTDNIEWFSKFAKNDIPPDVKANKNNMKQKIWWSFNLTYLYKMYVQNLK